VRRKEVYLSDAGGRWLEVSASTYDALGNVITSREAGVEHALTYDPLGLFVVAETETPSAGRTLRWTAEWDRVLGLPTVLADPANAVTRMTYDALGRKATVAVGDAPPHVRMAYEWSAPAPRTWTYVYDGTAEELTRDTSDPAHGAKWRASLAQANGAGEPSFTALRVRDDQWIISERLTRDDRGFVVSRARPFYAASATPAGDAPEERADKDALGRAYRTTLANGITRTVAISPLRQTVTVGGRAPVITDRDGLGRIVRTARTAAGALEESIASYDTLGALTDVSLQGGLVHHHFEYDSAGRLIATRDPDNGRRTMAYDDANRLVLATNAKGESTSLTYDGIGRIVTLSPGGGARTTYHYDDAKDADH